jgi:hypothetical protein
VPVLVVFGLDDAQRRTVNVLLNNPNAQGQWDMPALTALLSDLDGEGSDATLTGFSQEEFAKLLGEPLPDSTDSMDPGEDRYAEQYAVIVTCASEAEQKATYGIAPARDDHRRRLLDVRRPWLHARGPRSPDHHGVRLRARRRSGG